MLWVSCARRLYPRTGLSLLIWNLHALHKEIELAVSYRAQPCCFLSLLIFWITLESVTPPLLSPLFLACFSYCFSEASPSHVIPCPPWVWPLSQLKQQLIRIVCSLPGLIFLLKSCKIVLELKKKKVEAQGMDLSPLNWLFLLLALIKLLYSWSLL